MHCNTIDMRIGGCLLSLILFPHCILLLDWISDNVAVIASENNIISTEAKIYCTNIALTNQMYRQKQLLDQLLVVSVIGFLYYCVCAINPGLCWDCYFLYMVYIAQTQ